MVTNRVFISGNRIKTSLAKNIGKSLPKPFPAPLAGLGKKKVEETRIYHFIFI
jgi:hypothetical protein